MTVAMRWYSDGKDSQTVYLLLQSGERWWSSEDLSASCPRCIGRRWGKKAKSGTGFMGRGGAKGIEGGFVHRDVDFDYRNGCCLNLGLRF